MHTLGEIAQALGRPAVYIRGLLVRFDLPLLEGAGYPPQFLAFLRSVVYLRILNVPEETLRDLWLLEKKLLLLLHADSGGSPTWFLDACGQTGRRGCRLLLSNYDLGIPLPSRTLQPELNFALPVPELFAGAEMGEDALRVLGEYLKQYSRIRDGVMAETALLRAAARWSVRLG